MTHFSLSQGAGTPCACGYTVNYSEDWDEVDCIDCLRTVCKLYEKASQELDDLREGR
jgi:hypothetical protein